MITNSLNTSHSDTSPVIQRILSLFRQQIRRELGAELFNIIVHSNQFSELDGDAKAFGLSPQQLRWHGIFILKALKQALRVEIYDLSARTSTTRIVLSFSQKALRDALAAHVSRNIINRASMLNRLEWISETVRLTENPAMQMHLKWSLDGDEIRGELVSATALSKDWLSALLTREADALKLVVDRAFKTETMIQTKRFYNV